jgi:hypothetical protein
MLDEKLKDVSILQLTFTVLFMIIAFWPWVRDSWNPHAKTIDEDLKGEDKKWQAHELRARDSMRVGRVFVVFLCLMLFFLIMFDKQFPEFLWVMFFFGTLGSSGISAYLMKMGVKKEEKNERES